MPAFLSPRRAHRIDSFLDGALLLTVPALVVGRGAVMDWLAAAALTVTVLALWLVARRLLHQYRSSNGRGVRGDVALTLVMLAAILGPAWLLAALGIAPFTTTQVARLATVLAPAVIVAREALVAPGLWQSRPRADVLLAGIGPLGRLTGNEIIHGDVNRHVIGYLRFDDEAPHDRLRAPLLGEDDALDRVLREHAVDEVYFCSTASGQAAAVQRGIRVCERLGIPFALPACTYHLSRARPFGRAVADGYVHYSNVRATPFALGLKRLFDIALSGLALVLLSPVALLASLAIKLDSPGPVFFRQERVGLRGRTFSMLKFRSMVADAEQLKAALLERNEQSGPVFKIVRDPRITRVGRLLRKLSIDELPQLVNVLRGDMSLVGPRPPLPSEVAKYEAWQRRRLSVRPGITCVWQVSGRNEIGFEEWMLLDLRYIDHWSLRQDLSLVLRTIPVVLTGRGAS